MDREMWAFIFLIAIFVFSAGMSFYFLPPILLANLGIYWTCFIFSVGSIAFTGLFLYIEDLL